MAVKDSGYHNEDIHRAIDRLKSSKSYQDVSTVCVIPTRDGMLPCKVATAIWNLITPMNQRFHKFCVEGKEIGQAYTEVVQMILGNKELSKWKYLLTIEADNIPPPDGLMKLYESIDKFDAVGGLYWTKGPGGQAMGYGYPQDMPRNFRPIVPVPDAVVPVLGLGMGFSLFRISMFKELEKRGIKEFFKTVQEWDRGAGTRMTTQDLFFFDMAGKYGFTFALDCRVKVGHLDSDGTIW